MKPAPVLATMLLLVACGSGPTPTATVSSPSPSSSASAGTSPSPATTSVCSASNRCLALVMLRDGNATVVRDVTDIKHPFTVATYQHDWPQFDTGTLLSYVEGTNLFRTPTSGTPKALIASTGEQFSAYAWNPQADTVAYLAPSGSGTALHLVSGGRDVAIAGAIPAVPAVGCENQPCPGADTWDFRLSYSPDGAYISMELSLPGVDAFRLWTSEGKLVLSSDSASRSMSTWSGNALYFPDGKGIETLRNGAVSSFLPGVTWIHPVASPGGAQIVYETRDGQGWHHVFVVDTASHQVRELNKARTTPAFLTARYVWYRGEGSPGIYSGKTYIYDLQTGTESGSIITQVFDAWPHAA